MVKAGEKPIADSQGEVTNPTTSTLLADTGELSDVGLYEVMVSISALTALAQVQLEHRNTANAATLNDVPPMLVAAGTGAQFLFKIEVVNKKERIRAMMFANQTGKTWVHIEAQRVR